MQLEAVSYGYGVLPCDFWRMNAREVLLMIEARHQLADKKLRRFVAELSAEIRNGASMVSSRKAYKTYQKGRDIDPEAFLPWDFLED